MIQEKTPAIFVLTAHLGRKTKIATHDQTHLVLGGSCGKRPLAAWNGLAGATASDTKYPLSVPKIGCDGLCARDVAEGERKAQHL